MKDHNSINKLICISCDKEIDFIWSSGIYNNSSFARFCIDCRNQLMEDLYKKNHQLSRVAKVNLVEKKRCTVSHRN